MTDFFKFWNENPVIKVSHLNLKNKKNANSLFAIALFINESMINWRGLLKILFCRGLPCLLHLLICIINFVPHRQNYLCTDFPSSSSARNTISTLDSRQLCIPLYPVRAMVVSSCCRIEKSSRSPSVRLGRSEQVHSRPCWGHYFGPPIEFLCRVSTENHWRFIFLHFCISFWFIFIVCWVGGLFEKLS